MVVSFIHDLSIEIQKELFWKVEPEEDYEVEEILEKRVVKKGKIEYLVKWKNFEDPADNSWEPRNHLEAVQDLIDNFEKDLEAKQDVSSILTLG